MMRKGRGRFMVAAEQLAATRSGGSSSSSLGRRSTGRQAPVASGLSARVAPSCSFDSLTMKPVQDIVWPWPCIHFLTEPCFWTCLSSALGSELNP